MIPDKSHPKWREVLSARSRFKAESFSLQMTINLIRNQISINHLTINEAVNLLYEKCEKYERIYENDLKTIFNSSK